MHSRKRKIHAAQGDSIKGPSPPNEVPDVRRSWCTMSPATAADGRLLIALIAAGSSFGSLAAVSKPLVSCPVSVNCV